MDELQENWLTNTRWPASRQPSKSSPRIMIANSKQLEQQHKQRTTKTTGINDRHLKYNIITLLKMYNNYQNKLNEFIHFVFE